MKQVLIGKVIGRKLPKYWERWEKARVILKDKRYIIRTINLITVVAQWLAEGDFLRVETDESGITVYRRWEMEWVKIYPLFRKEYVYPRLNPLTGEPLYTYKLVAREAETIEDYIAIIDLEQYHYASKKEIVAVWRCDDRIVESNVPPRKGCIPVAIKSSLPSSRFMVLELAERQPYEPRIVGYVRVDAPIPLMHRRVVKDGEVYIEKNIRLKVFPREWIYPTFWPEILEEKLKKEFLENKTLYGRRRARYLLAEKIKEEALKRCNTAAARIARVVIHPDYRGDGLGSFAVKAAIEWIKERRIPEMKKRKHIVETIAMMARYHPFFEKVGFKYLWDTASGRPALYYPLTKEAEERIKKFLETDPIASKHKGRLYVSRYVGIEPLNSPLKLKSVWKSYESVLDVSALTPPLADALKAFGVTRRVVQKQVLRDVSLEIKPGEIVVLAGISGAGKTTLLRLIAGKALLVGDSKYMPDAGEIELPSNTKVSILFPGEIEPRFGQEPLLQHVFNKLGDVYAAIEVLNMSGLSDAVLYRARFGELSTGQKERAKIASLLAEKPNLIIIDEFAAHLDALTARRVARNLAKIARKHGITVIVSTHKKEVIDSLAPEKIVYVGYGSVFVEERGAG